jgi:protein-arginine kinase activator protein McsA
MEDLKKELEELKERLYKALAREEYEVADLLKEKVKTLEIRKSAL